MSLLVRKIDKAKWLQNNIVNCDDVSADAITNCMKTSENKLSTWHIEEEESLDEAVLAIVSAHKHLDTIDIVWMNQDQLSESGIKMQNTQGLTPVVDLVDSHVDIKNLTYKSLGTVASCIVQALAEEKVRRYTRGALKKLLHKAIDSKRLDPERLDPSVYSKLQLVANESALHSTRRVDVQSRG